MKTKNNIWIAIIIFSLFNSSCDDFINEEPVSKLTTENMWVGLRDAQAGIAGIYTTFRSTILYNYWYWGEFRGDNFKPINASTSEPVKLMQNSLDVTLSSTLWTNLYKTINAANAGIKYIPRCDISDVVLKNDLLGQAYAMRALCYFYATRVWGAVPVSLNPTESSNDLPISGRVSRDSVLRYVIIPDLEKAEQYISPQNVSRKQISMLAVYAIRADVDMWLKNWERVNLYCDKFISLSNSQSPTTGTYGRCKFEMNIQTLSSIMSKGIDYTPSDFNYLIDEYGGMNELVFVIPFYLKDWDQSSLIGPLFGGNQPPSGGGAYSLTNEFLGGLNSVGDLRYNWIVGNATSKNNLAKFVFPGTVIPYYSLRNCQQSYPIYRATEIYLMKSEANANMNKYSDALNIIKDYILTRAGIPSLVKKESDFAKLPEDLVEYIQEQKRIEMVGEGKRFFDLARTGLWDKFLGTASTYSGNKIDDERKLLFPINYIHIDQGRGLINQNWPY